VAAASHASAWVFPLIAAAPTICSFERLETLRYWNSPRRNRGTREQPADRPLPVASARRSTRDVGAPAADGRAAFVEPRHCAEAGNAKAVNAVIPWLSSVMSFAPRLGSGLRRIPARLLDLNLRAFALGAVRDCHDPRLP
jgi:hypothetical protein